MTITPIPLAAINDFALALDHTIATQPVPLCPRNLTKWGRTRINTHALVQMAYQHLDSTNKSSAALVDPERLIIDYNVREGEINGAAYYAPIFALNYHGLYTESPTTDDITDGIPIRLAFATRFVLEDLLNGANYIGGLTLPDHSTCREAVESMVARYDEAKAVSVTQQGNQFTVTMTFATPDPSGPAQGSFTIAHNPNSEPVIC